MADTQEAPQVVQDQNAQEGGLIEAQNAILKMMEPQEETPETEEEQPTEEEESQPIEEDESLEEVSDPEEEEEGEEESVEEEEEEDSLYMIRVDGEDIEVTLDELQKGYSRQSDYTRKTQEIASERKQMQSLQDNYKEEVAKIQAERQQYVNFLTDIVNNNMPFMQEYQNIDWEDLRQTNPIEYVTKKEEFRDAQEKLQKLHQERENSQRLAESEMQNMRVDALKAEHSALVEKVPEWGDPEKQPILATALKSYANSQGFTGEELKELIDHRSLIVLQKAMLYDRLQSSDIKEKKLKNKPRVVRTGKGINKKQSSKKVRATKMKRLQQSGHIDDAASLLEDMFNPN